MAIWNVWSSVNFLSFVIWMKMFIKQFEFSNEQIKFDKSINDKNIFSRPESITQGTVLQTEKL